MKTIRVKDEVWEKLMEIKIGKKQPLSDIIENLLEKTSSKKRK